MSVLGATVPIAPAPTGGVAGGAPAGAVVRVTAADARAALDAAHDVAD